MKLAFGHSQERSRVERVVKVSFRSSTATKMVTHVSFTFSRWGLVIFTPISTHIFTAFTHQSAMEYRPWVKKATFPVFKLPGIDPVCAFCLETLPWRAMTSLGSCIFQKPSQLSLIKRNVCPSSGIIFDETESPHHHPSGIRESCELMHGRSNAWGKECYYVLVLWGFARVLFAERN